jgi:hypothetical protein
MTYAELLQELQKLTPEQLNQDVTVFISEQDEYYPLKGDYPFPESDCDDVLDNGHRYLVI